MGERRRLELRWPEGGRTVLETEHVGTGALSEVLRREALGLNTRCGQRGLCDGCMVELIEGRLIETGSGEVVEGNGAPRRVHGCKHRVGAGGAVVGVPAGSLLAHEPQVVSAFRVNVCRGRDPLWRGSAGEELKGAFGAAIDVGTTTVAVVVVSLDSGEVVGQASGFNQQVHLGEDVLTRIELCSRDPAMIGRLQEAVVGETVGELIRAAAAEAGVDAGELKCMSVAGNTTMLHLWAGVDPSSLGVAPFTPMFLDHRVMEEGGGAAVHLLPSAAAYLGADITAGIVSSGMCYESRSCLLVDIGTNGEIVLSHEGRLYGCSTAAGPAFEGARLGCGVRAGRGAIAHVEMGQGAGEVRIEVIGDEKPIGLCGSAYVDFLAEARRVGLIGATGRYCGGVGEERMIGLADGGRGFIVARGRGREPIVVSERDIASLLSAKAAIAAGVRCLLKRAGIEARELETVYLAGGFGLHVDVGRAIGCGLLPGMKVEQVQSVGNSSLGGAYLALLDRGALEEMRRVAGRMEVVELSTDPAFEETYIDELALG